MTRDQLIEAMCAAHWPLWTGWLDKSLADAARADMARVLAAVEPHIRVQALREAADWFAARDWLQPPEHLRDMADRIERGEP